MKDIVAWTDIDYRPGCCWPATGAVRTGTYTENVSELALSRKFFRYCPKNKKSIVLGEQCHNLY